MDPSTCKYQLPGQKVAGFPNDVKTIDVNLDISDSGAECSSQDFASIDSDDEDDFEHLKKSDDFEPNQDIFVKGF